MTSHLRAVFHFAATLLVNDGVGSCTSKIEWFQKNTNIVRQFSHPLDERFRFPLVSAFKTTMLNKSNSALIQGLWTFSEWSSIIGFGGGRTFFWAQPNEHYLRRKSPFEVMENFWHFLHSFDGHNGCGCGQRTKKKRCARSVKSTLSSEKAAKSFHYGDELEPFIVSSFLTALRVCDAVPGISIFR